MSNEVGSEPRNDVVAAHVAPVSAARPGAAAAAYRVHRHNDAWLAATGLVGGLLALPLAQNTWHGPEVAAVLAVSATALLARQRWAIALIVIADLLLLPTVWPRAFLSGDLESRCVALITLAAIVPGVLAMRRAAAVLVVMSGRRRTHKMCRRVHGVLVAMCVVAALVPLVHVGG